MDLATKPVAAEVHSRGSKGTQQKEGVLRDTQTEKQSAGVSSTQTHRWGAVALQHSTDLFGERISEGFKETVNADISNELQ